MRKSLRLRVGGLTLAVSAPEPTPRLEPPGRLRPFLVPRGGDIRLRLTREEPPAPAESDRLFDSGSVWRVYRWQDGLLYVFRTAVLSPPVYAAIAIDERLRAGRLFLPPRRGYRAYALAYPAEELLFQHRLAKDGAIEVHASAVVVDGRAFVFCGTSGAGKSTTARLWRRFRRDSLVLSDDRVVLRRRGRAPWAFGTPWHGSGRFASPEGRPVAGIFFLRHGRRHRLTPLTGAAAAGRLLARSFPPPWDGPALGRALEWCGEATQAVPCFEFAFRPDTSACREVLTWWRG